MSYGEKKGYLPPVNLARGVAVCQGVLNSAVYALIFFEANADLTLSGVSGKS
jgi:hypothetical protein